jgi:xylulose-5-phosphate/fructose-6-phosphate phosphoketolase
MTFSPPISLGASVTSSDSIAPVGPLPLSSEEVRLLDAWWRAANYLPVGMIYLQDNPLLLEPLRP